jgi:hyperosmotically inducible periplasmic protein
MKLKFTYKVLVPSAILSLGLVVPGFSQSDNGATTSEQMNTAGQSMKQAGSDTAAAAQDVYHGTATVVHDTAITAKVKAALHGDRTTEHSQIHVTTAAGIVTLRGKVPSADVANRAEELAQSTKGVKEVKNELKVSGTMMAD